MKLVQYLHVSMNQNALFLQWYKTPNTSVILSTQATYSVQAATVAISGTYVCTASNGQPQPQQGTARVTVSPPPTTTVTVAPTTATAERPTTEFEEVGT